MKFMKKISIWTISVVALLSACFLPMTVVNATNDYSGALQHLTEVQRIARAMQTCISMMYGEGKTNGKWSATTNSQDLFKPLYGGILGVTQSVYVGYELENKVQGKTNDAQIYCSGDSGNQSKIVDLFANAITDGNLATLWCDGSNAGLFQPYYFDGTNEQKYTSGNGCQDHLNEAVGDYYYKWADRAQVDAYLAKLYNEYVNNFAQQYGISSDLYSDWGNLYAMSDAQKYYSTLGDFMSLCTTGNTVDVGSQVNVNKYFTGPQDKGIFYNANGTHGELRYFERKSGLSSSNQQTCIAMANDLNNLADALDRTFIALDQDAIERQKERDKQNCNNEVPNLSDLKQQAQSLLAFDRTQPGTIPNDLLSDARKIINGTYNFWTENENGKIVCQYPKSLLTDDVITTPPDDDDGDDNDVPEVPVYNPPQASGADPDACNGAAGALGWILCPVLKMVSQGVDDIYDGYVQQQFLEVNAANLNPETEYGAKVYSAWGAIRNIANIIFVILFMVVVLSQITGFGISNYGIKKILPKLIVIAVLVNISFLICQFAVDLSNVLGYSLNSMFDSLSGSVRGLTGSFNSTSTTANWINTLGAAILAGTAGSWLPTFLLTLVSAAISVFFGALILGARQAGIYILIILAPVAIVCYALPNTKKLFDRWLKVLTSLLIVFPICGALVGGGNFASTVLLGSGGFFMTLVAMLLRVVPFFLIPGLVRSAMAAMGNVGAKISSLGSRLGGTATGGIRKSDAFQRGSEFVERNLRGRPRAWLNSKLRKTKVGRSKVADFLLSGSDRRIAAMVGKQEARVRNDNKARSIAQGGFISREQMKDMAAAANEAEENRGIDEAASAIKAMMDTGDAGALGGKLEALLKEMEAKPGSVEVRRRMKAITKLMLESDDGRGALTEAAHKFAKAHPTSEATKALGKYLGNTENMGIIKGKNQRGLQNLVQHINKGQAIQSLAQYNAMGAGKIGAGAVGGLDESFLKAQVAAARSGELSGSDLQKFADTYTRALTSENAANEIPPELVDYLNNIRSLAYPGSAPLQPGEMLPIPHVTMPAGWNYDNVTQRWVDGHGAALSREDAIKAEEIAKHNARADIDNP